MLIILILIISEIVVLYMLYLVATPIGNLGDISQRALDALRSCDYILCEDTRHTLKLCTHYGIQKPLKSFHKFNETEKESRIIHDLKQGKQIALVSDAGTPGIADPGFQLVQQAIKEEILVTAIPGACAAIVALTISGLNTERFQFVGFLPKKAGELQRDLLEILAYTGTTICYESPHRLVKTLHLLQKLAPDRELVVARELTKKFEESKRGTATQLVNAFEGKDVKGEIVLMISGNQSNAWEELTPEEHIALLEKTYQLSHRDAVKMAAEQRQIPKRVLYKLSTKQSE